jgi:ABC-2 type transport system permease protein
MDLLRVRAIANKEFVQIWRDPRSLAMAIFIPLLLLIMFGYILDLDVNRVPTVIWDQDGSKAARDYLRGFGDSRYFDIRGYYNDYDDLRLRIDDGRAILAVVVPKDFSRILDKNANSPVQLIADGSDSNTARIAMSYAGSVTARFNENLMRDALYSAGITRPVYGVDVRPRIWFNEDLKSRNYIIPGLIAVIMMVIAALLTSLTVAREWERGTMEQLISTPVTAKELIAGKFIPYFIIGLVDLTVSVAMALFVFRVPFRGDVALLFFFSSIFLIGALSLGILISIVMRNQLLASQTAILATFLPAFLLSGFMYAIINMPKAIQVITCIVPARYFINILRGIYLKGVGFSILWKQALFLVIFAVLVTGAAVRLFKKKIA